LKQLKVGLGSELRSELEAAALRSGRSLADEIRARVAWTLDLDPMDDLTRDVITAVARLSEEIELETNYAWHSHAGAHTALRWGIATIIDNLKPEADVTFLRPRPHRANPADDAQIIGMVAGGEAWEMRSASREDRASRRAKRQWICREILKLEHQQAEQEGDKS
jgi:hypothetical protein